MQIRVIDVAGTYCNIYTKAKMQNRGTNGELEREVNEPIRIGVQRRDRLRLCRNNEGPPDAVDCSLNRVLVAIVD